MRHPALGYLPLRPAVLADPYPSDHWLCAEAPVLRGLTALPVQLAAR